MKPRIFIGSSSESHHIASALHENIEHAAEVTLWTHNVFEPSKYTLESLLDHLDRAQFAVFVMAGDDLATMRGQEVRVARDNVLLELGLFMGRLGREKCFILAAKDKPLHLPSDIAGLNLLEFDDKRSDRNFVAATGSAAQRLLRAIELRNAEHRSRDAAQRIKATETVRQVLQVAARLIALRAGLKETEVRGFLHLYDDEEKCLIPAALYDGIRLRDDAEIHIPCNCDEKSQWYIISRAFCENRIHCSEVEWKKPNLGDVPHRPEVWEDLKSVVACPLRLNRRELRPIGTIAFDSSEELSVLCWRTDQGQTDQGLSDVLKLLAEILFTVVTKVY